MSTQNIERIYLLKSEGVAAVLADIRSITAAFKESSQAAAQLRQGGGMFDANQMATTNKLLSQMVDIQGELLASIKATNSEFSKSAPVMQGVGKSAVNAATGMEDLSVAAKAVGSNLSSTTPQLMKMQSALDANKVEGYDTEINKLVRDLVILQQRLEANKVAFERQFTGNPAISKFTADAQKKGFSIVDNKVMAGKAEIPELTAEYVRLQASVDSVIQTYAQYLKEQMEITNQAKQLTSAINLLNTTNNSSVPIENALAYKQEADALALTAKATDELLEGQIVLDAMQGEINAKRKQAAYFVSGQATKDEEALLQKQIAYGERYIAVLEREAEAVRKREAAKRENQEMRGSARADLYDTNFVGGNKAGQKMERVDIEMAKEKALILNQETSYYYRLAASVNALKISMRLLSEEEVKDERIMGILEERLRELNAEVTAFELNMGNGQRQVGQYGLAIAGVGNVMTMFTRQFARAIGSLLIWGALFEAITAIAQAIKEAIPGTEAYEAKQEALIQANEALTASFKDLTESMLKTRDAQRIVYEGINDGLDASKRYEATIKALGIIAGESGQADRNQTDAHIKTLRAELKLLTDKEKVLRPINDLLKTAYKESEEYLANPQVFDAMRGLLGQVAKGQAYELLQGRLLSRVKQSEGIPEEEKIKLVTKLTQEFAKGGDILVIFRQALRDVTVELNKNTQEILTNKAAQTDADRALLAKNNALVYEKNKELRMQLLQLDETYRQLNEERQAESTDKIVKDVKAKYRLITASISQAEEDYKKQYSGDENDPKYLASLEKYAKERANAMRSQVAEINNKLSTYLNGIIDKVLTQEINKRGFGVAEAQKDAGLAKFKSDYGIPSYSNMAEANDKERAAKLASLDEWFLQQNKLYTDNKAGLAHLIEIRNAEGEKINSEHYMRMLKSASDYYHRVTEVASMSLANDLQQLNIIHTDKESTILESESWFKEFELQQENKRAIIASSNHEIEELTKKHIEAQKATAKASANLDVARGVDGNMGNEQEASLVYGKALNEQQDIEAKMAEARKKRAQALSDDNKKYLQAAADGMIAIGQKMADNYMSMLEKQDAYRNEMAHRSLDWNNMIMDSEMQSDNEKMAHRKANVRAEQELDREKALRDRKRAEQQIIINGVIAISKAWADSGNPILAGIETAVILAEMGIEESMLAKVPAYAQGTGNHPGGLAWVGDGGESEIAKIGSSYFSTPSVPTLVDMPAGAQVTPFSQIGNMGTGLKAPMFTAGVSSGSSASGGADYTPAFQEIHATLATVTKGLANMSINYNAHKAGKAAVQASFKTRRI